MQQPRINRVCIVHGHGGSGATHWQTWLARKCERVLKLETHYPKLPDRHGRPMLPAWLEALDRTLPFIDSTTALIGHSLGCPTILQLLRRRDLHLGEVGLVVLAAPSSRSRVLVSELSFLTHFYDGLHNHELQLRNLARSAHVYASENDQWVNPPEAARLARDLHAEMHWLNGAGHINVASGHHTLPEVFKLLSDSVMR